MRASPPAAAALIVLLAAAPAASLEKPLWEFGLGVATMTLPVYRGADERRQFALPLPYVVYRGEFFKADRRGVRGELFDRGRLEIDLAGGASPPVGSGDIAARRGMPDLHATLGLGPALDYLAWRAADRRSEIRWQLPTVASFTAERDVRFVGWQATPRVNFDLLNPLGARGWRLGLLAGPIYASRRQNAYFYRVAPEHADAGRAAYQTPGGYAGREVLLSLSRRFPGFWVGAFARHDDLRGAVFADSPLVRRRDYVAAGLAVAWMVDESPQRVRAEND